MKANFVLFSRKKWSSHVLFVNSSPFWEKQYFEKCFRFLLRENTGKHLFENAIISLYLSMNSPLLSIFDVWKGGVYKLSRGFAPESYILHISC